MNLINFSRFSNIKNYLRILRTFPVATCTCERSFSSMRRLKNYICNTMVSERLNRIAIMHQVKTCGIISYKSFFFINFVFVENSIVIMLAFHSSIAREVVDSIQNYVKRYVFNTIYVFGREDCVIPYWLLPTEGIEEQFAIVVLSS